MQSGKLYKNNDTDTVQWLDTDSIGEHWFTFDGKKFYNLFRDYPDKLSKKEKAIFDDENPYWANFFRDRQDK